MSGGGFDERDDVDLLAAEYVIGTLDAPERAAFAARIRDDEAAHASVAAWTARFAGLDGRVDAIAPAADVWPRIEKALSARASATMHPFKVIPGGGHGTGDSGALRTSRNRWRTGAILSGAVAATLLVALIGQSLRGPAIPDASTYVAAVNRGGDKPALIVRVDLKTGKVLVRPVAAKAPEGRSLELWYIGDDKTPRSMGLVDRAMTDLRLPGTPDGNATFAVSVEPPGGSKTGGPTGPVVYSGQLVKE